MSGTQQFVYQKWPNRIFPLVNVVFSDCGDFGLERGGSPEGPSQFCNRLVAFFRECFYSRLTHSELKSRMQSIVDSCGCHASKQSDSRDRGLIGDTPPPPVVYGHSNTSPPPPWLQCRYCTPCLKRALGAHGLPHPGRAKAEVHRTHPLTTQSGGRGYTPQCGPRLCCEWVSRPTTRRAVHAVRAVGCFAPLPPKGRVEILAAARPE